MQDRIKWSRDGDPGNYVVFHEVEPGSAFEIREVLPVPGQEVVNSDDLPSPSMHVAADM
jgi:hypothetical protein